MIVPVYEALCAIPNLHTVIQVALYVHIQFKPFIFFS